MITFVANIEAMARLNVSLLRHTHRRAHIREHLILDLPASTVFDAKTEATADPNIRKRQMPDNHSERLNLTTWSRPQAVVVPTRAPSARTMKRKRAGSTRSTLRGRDGADNTSYDPERDTEPLCHRRKSTLTSRHIRRSLMKCEDEMSAREHGNRARTLKT